MSVTRTIFDGCPNFVMGARARPIPPSPKLAFPIGVAQGRLGFANARASDALRHDAQANLLRSRFWVTFGGSRRRTGRWYHRFGPWRYILAMVYKTQLGGSWLDFGDCCDMSIGKI
jgi:hypothetical protein